MTLLFNLLFVKNLSERFYNVQKIGDTFEFDTCAGLNSSYYSYNPYSKQVVYLYGDFAPYQRTSEKCVLKECETVFTETFKELFNARYSFELKKKVLEKVLGFHKYENFHTAEKGYSEGYKQFDYVSWNAFVFSNFHEETFRYEGKVLPNENWWLDIWEKLEGNTVLVPSWTGKVVNVETVKRNKQENVLRFTDVKNNLTLQKVLGK